MSEKEKDTTDMPEQHDPLTPETFSFFDVLEERDFPKDEVEIYMDEVSAHELRKVMFELTTVDLDDPRADELHRRAIELEEKREASKYRFHITGVADDTITDLADVANAEFDEKRKEYRSVTGKIERRLEGDEQRNYLRYYNALVLSVHIEQIVRLRDGAVMTAPPVEEIALLVDKAPTSQKAKLQRAIEELRVDSSAFEARVDADFLAKP